MGTVPDNAGMFDAYDRIQERLKPGQQLKTPDAKVGATFTIETVDLRATVEVHVRDAY